MELKEYKCENDTQFVILLFERNRGVHKMAWNLRWKKEKEKKKERDRERWGRLILKIFCFRFHFDYNLLRRMFFQGVALQGSTIEILTQHLRQPIWYRAIMTRPFTDWLNTVWLYIYTCWILEDHILY
jgi:hypothetical protein